MWCRIKACDGAVFYWTETIHARMLHYRVLLELLGITAVIKSNQVCDGDAAVKNLDADEYVVGCAQFELTVIVKQCGDLGFGINFGNHQLATGDSLEDTIPNLSESRHRLARSEQRQSEVVVCSLHKLAQ